MLTLDIFSPEEIAVQLAQHTRQLRLAQNLTRKTLSERSGVSLGSIQRFEQTGAISLISLLKLAHVLSALQDFQHLMQVPGPKTTEDLEAREKVRKRGRV